MANQLKYDRILDALQELLENRKLQSISVSEIAHTAGDREGEHLLLFSVKRRDSWKRLWSAATKNRSGLRRPFPRRLRSPRSQGWR